MVLTAEQAREIGRLGGLARRRLSPQERLDAKRDKTGECWTWTGKSKNANGYGLIFHNGKLKTAHRAAWEMVCGPVPDGYDVLHTCDEPGCTRNDTEGWYWANGNHHPRLGHLWVGTKADNMQDAIAKGRFFSQRHPEQAQAKAAHARRARLTTGC